MKILHVAPSLARSYGGPTQCLVGYSAAALAAGNEVTVVAPRCAPEELDAVQRQSGVQNVKLFPAVSRGSFIVSPKLVAWVRREARNFDVVHVHGLFNSVSSWSIRAARIAGAAVAICPHGTLSRYTLRHRRTAIKRLYLSAIERSNISLADALHFTTDTERDEAAWHGLNLADKSFVVPPPFVPETHPESDPARRDEEPMVLFLSRIHKVKNIEALLRAWEIVSREVPHARLVIAGQGPDALVGSLKALSERLGIEKTVSFTGFAGPAEKARLFAEAKVLALPSHHENFGLVVLEAIAAGLPVVISPEVQLGPFVTTHGLGLVSQTDPPSLAAGLLSVMSDATLQRKVATEGESLVREHYSPEAIGPALMTMYVSALARRTAST